MATGFVASGPDYGLQLLSLTVLAARWWAAKTVYHQSYVLARCRYDQASARKTMSQNAAAKGAPAEDWGGSFCKECSIGNGEWRAYEDRMEYGRPHGAASRSHWGAAIGVRPIPYI